MLPPANGALIKEVNDTAVWYIRDGKRYHLINDPSAFNRLGIKLPDDVELVQWADIYAIPDSGQLEDGSKGSVLPGDARALGWRTPYMHQFSSDILEGNGAYHIDTFSRLWPDGKVEIRFIYRSDSMWGFCGGTVVGIMDSDNKLLAEVGPPSGCISGKLAGAENTRTVEWGGKVTPKAVQNAKGLFNRAYPTSGGDKLLGGIQVAAHVFSTVVSALADGSGSDDGGA